MTLRSRVTQDRDAKSRSKEVRITITGEETLKIRMLDILTIFSIATPITVVTNSHNLDTQSVIALKNFKFKKDIKNKEKYFSPESILTQLNILRIRTSKGYGTGLRIDFLIQ